MDYEEKYKAALERARQFGEHSLQGDSADIVECIFPELQGNNDERIRKELITHCRNTRCVTEEGAERIAKWVAWLEKQGEQKHFSDFKASDWYVSKVDGKIHNIYQSVDRAEPKFKVGDWIVTYKGDTVQIGAVNDGYYTIGNGMDFNSSYVDGCWHKWTIQDAKDGDVLVDSYSKDSTIILYKGIYKERTVLAHCGWNGYNLSVNKNGLGYGGLDNTNYLPATKEQRDLLFQKMADAGYEWDAEKKELKKIESKKLDADEVIEWLNHRELMSNEFINRFKKYFKL